jgi:hypothetical protein
LRLRAAMNNPRSLLPLALLLGCNATYAPPVRSTHYGLPGRLAPGQGELAVAMGGPNTHGSASLSIPIASNVRVEGTYDLSETWHIGSAGVRGTIPLGGIWYSDLEGGVGAGVGGERCANHRDTTQVCAAGAADGLRANERFAYGGYLGGAVGLRPWRAAGFYVRVRAQLSAAQNIDPTFWGAALLGAEFALGPVRTHLAGGAVTYVNRAESQAGALVELGISVPFSLR